MKVKYLAWEILGNSHSQPLQPARHIASIWYDYIHYDYNSKFSYEHLPEGYRLNQETLETSQQIIQDWHAFEGPNWMLLGHKNPEVFQQLHNDIDKSSKKM